MSARLIDCAAPEVQAEFDALWRALDGNVQELTRRLDAATEPASRTQLAPAPDYRMSEPDEGPCGCDEAIALRIQNEQLRASLDSSDTHVQGLLGQVAAANALLELLRALAAASAGIVAEEMRRILAGQPASPYHDPIAGPITPGDFNGPHGKPTGCLSTAGENGRGQPCRRVSGHAGLCRFYGASEQE